MSTAATKVGNSPELCKTIASWASGSSLRALSLTSKHFLRPIRARLFRALYFTDLSQAGAACRTICESEALLTHIRAIYVLTNAHRTRQTSRTLSVNYDHWHAITRVLKQTPNLETVLLADPTFENTWVFKELGQPPFQARTVKVQFDWDENLVEFLATQRELKVLETSCPDPYRHLYPHDRDEVSGSRSPTPQMLHLPTIPVGRDVQFLPVLEKLETQLHIAQQILAPFPGRTHFPPLKCLQINRLGMAEVSLLSFLPNLRWVHKTIRSLQVELPEAIVWQCMDIITQTTPNIQCIGILALPSTQLHLLTGSLLRLPHLVALEVDVTSWGHHPPQPPAQRALASLFRTFAPTLRTVGFWVNGKRWTWRINKPPAHEAVLNWDGNPEGQGKWYGVMDGGDYIYWQDM